jgi:hypothetical protein
MPTGTDTSTVHYIAHAELPVGRKPKYFCVVHVLVAEYKRNKEEKYRISFTYSGWRQGFLSRQSQHQNC